MKRILAIFTAAMVLVFAGCAKNNNTAQGGNEGVNVAGISSGFKVASLKGPTSMGIVKMMQDNKNNNYEMYGTADEAVAKLTKGEIDIALVPANLAAVLYNKTGGQVRVAGINTLGVLYIVEKGDSIKSVADLKGKTIVSTGKGTTPEYSLNYILSQNGIDPNKDVNVEYKSEATEAANEVIAGKEAVAVLPQPYVSTVLAKNSDLHIALNLTEEWNKVSSDSAMITGVVLVRKEVAESKGADLNVFLEEYKRSVDYVNGNVDDAAKLVAEQGIAAEEAAKNAIPYCNIVLIDGDEMKTKLLGYWQVLYNQNPASVGGKLPDEAICYAK